MTDKLMEENVEQEVTETMTLEPNTVEAEVPTQAPVEEEVASPAEQLAAAPFQEEEVVVEETTEEAVVEEPFEASQPVIEEVEIVEPMETEEITEEVKTSESREAQGVLSVVKADVFNKMTKRNQQFMIALDKNLIAANLTESVRRDVYTELCETLVEGQHTGQTARQLYGTPTECAQTILKQQFPTKETGGRSSDLHLAIDGGLVLGSLYTLLTAFMLMRGKNTSNHPITLGVITLIINYIMAGIAMMYTSRNMPNLDAPDRSKGYLKYFAISIATMGLWIFAVSASQMFLPKSINVVLPTMAYLFIGAITFALHFYLKKAWNIRGGVF